jgi:predicted chitinase
MGHLLMLARCLGNTAAGDGALFHGRGFVQLTGRRNYTKAKSLTGVDVVTQPDRAKGAGASIPNRDTGNEGWMVYRQKIGTLYHRR